MLYILAQVVVKVSIALLIVRIFPVLWMRRATMGFIALLIAHNLVFLFLIAFQCRPVASIWDKHILGTCLDITAIADAGAAMSIAEDIALILLPIPELWKLRASLGRRLQLILIFTFHHCKVPRSRTRRDSLLIPISKQCDNSEHDPVEVRCII